MSLLFLSHCIRRLLRSRSAVVSLVCVSILCAVAGAYTTYWNTDYGQANKEVIDRVVSANEGFAADGRLTDLKWLYDLWQDQGFVSFNGVRPRQPMRPR